MELCEKKFQVEVEAQNLRYQIQGWGKPNPPAKNIEHAPEQSAEFLQKKMQSENPALQIKMLDQFHSPMSIQIPPPATATVEKYIWGKADAVYSQEKNITCAVRVADCIPILLWSFEKPICAAIHAGWRGLHNQITPLTIACLTQKFSIAAQSLHAWVGAHIAQNSYPVKEDVFALFDNEFSSPAPEGNEYRLLNTTLILKKQLLHAGVPLQNIFWNHENVFQSRHWFSHRAGDKGRNIFFISQLPRG